MKRIAGETWQFDDEDDFSSGCDAGPLILKRAEEEAAADNLGWFFAGDLGDQGCGGTLELRRHEESHVRRREAVALKSGYLRINCRSALSRAGSRNCLSSASRSAFSAALRPCESALS
jgi:hypothetical protein